MRIEARDFEVDPILLDFVAFVLDVPSQQGVATLLGGLERWPGKLVTNEESRVASARRDYSFSYLC